MTGLSRPPSRWLPGRLRWSRRTVRMRLTILYAALFLASGTVLIAITSVLAATDNPPLQEYGVRPANGPAQSAGIAVPGFLRQFMASGYAQEVQQHAAVQRELLTQSLIALAAMSVISVGLGWLVAGRFLRPLRTITVTARRVSASSLNERLALAGPDDELKELADTFDGLLSRLEQSFEAQRRFVANASHELRTPVTRQRAMAEVALGDQSPTVESLRDACTGVLEASIEQERLIEALLTLARSQRGLSKRAPADLADITERVTRARRPAARSQGLTMETSLAAAPFHGDGQLAERLVANLVDNAMLHNVPGGSLRVRTATVREGGAALCISNTGPVIPPTEVSSLFEPFRRLGAERTANRDGLGLGLSIVDAITAAHGAVLRARALPGGGLEVRVYFPPDKYSSAGQRLTGPEDTPPRAANRSGRQQTRRIPQQ